MWKAPVQNKILIEKIEHKLKEIDTILGDQQKSTPLGLMNGGTGHLLYHCYRSLQLDSSAYSDAIEFGILQSFENLKSVKTGVFSMGVSGILWALNHLNQEDFIEIEQENFSDISASLSNSLLKNSISQNFDYLHGANGIALYLMNRTEPSAHQYFEQWLNLLYENANTTNDAIAWRTLINAKEQLYGYSLGLAHGAPSIILILIQLLKKQNNVKALDMLKKSIAHLLSNINPKQPIHKEMKNFFPNYIAKGKAFNVSRLAWCYGDLGCAFALFHAGKFLNQTNLIDISNEIMFHHAENVSDEQAKLNTDADFCHGTVGVAHMFARYYNYTGLESYRNASEFYYEKTLNMAIHKNGLAGYQHFEEAGYANNYTLLEGISGIGLSLMSAISQHEPKWDSALLLS
jgi:lantibiotic biosynthesis protein